MNYLKIKINKCDLIVIQENYVDCDTLGYAEKDEMVGMSEFSIPSERLKLMRDFYPEEIFEKEILADMDSDEHDLENDYWSTNADILIYWLYFITNNFNQYTLRLNCENLFWVAHDLMHVKHDFYGYQFSCSAYDELIRHRQAYKILQRRNIKVSNDFLIPIIDIYNKQDWGCNGTYRESRPKVTLSTIKTYKNINNW